MTGDITPPHEERIDPQEGAVDAARVEALLETLQVTADGETDATPADGAADSSPSPEGEAGDRLGQLQAELATLRSENESLRGQYMRIAADFDNFRKRQSRDKEDQRLHITCTTLTEILPVVDNFDRARQQLNPQSEEAQTLHRSYQNLYKQLVDVFKQLGVSPMRVEGEPFDPSLHEAVLREPSEEHPEDVVIEELQRGYHLDARVLRHALVKVSMGPGPAGGTSPSDAPAPPSEGQSD
ncbi:MAG: nucleotide exchange factor GrpE [Aphanothece saxicola GSE-SYN-MK-01-06B]|jgi:molecular chaperone GrpE|nr:nucleotide exchange factor GrpE [Aphanothece saxicola GSE-SYN-MK-01-06B]